MKKLILFDAYGTLFDVYSVGVLAEELHPGKGAKLSTLWRDKQLEYSRLRALAGRYKSFWAITVDALDYSIEALAIQPDALKRKALLEAYAKLNAFPEVLSVLQQLKSTGIHTAILSNGNPEMVDKAVNSAGLASYFSKSLSVEDLQTFKVDPRVYQMGLEEFSASKEEALFVSSNGWDVCGAAWFGLDTLWLNRAGLPRERLDIEPTFEGADLRAVLEVIE